MRYALVIFGSVVLRQLISAGIPYYKAFRARHLIIALILETLFVLLWVVPVASIILAAAFGGVFADFVIALGGLLKRLHLQ